MKISSSGTDAVLEQPAGKPLTLLRLLFYLIKGYITGLPKALLWTVIRSVAAFLVTLILHTWLVVVKNDGFWPDPKNPFYRLIAFTATKGDALAFWGIASFILFSLAGRIWSDGPIKFFSDLVSTPDWIIRSFRKSGRLSVPMLLSGIVLSVSASFLVQSKYVLVTAAVGLFLSYTLQSRGLWFLFLSTGWSDFNRLFMKRKTINHGAVSVLILGAVLGTFLAAILPQDKWKRIIVILLCITGIILILRKKITPRELLWISSFLAFHAILWKAAGVFADDGGWQEAGGTFKSWWNRPGRNEAIKMGVLPALYSLLGALLGGSNVPKPPPVPEVMDYNVKGWKWLQENGKWVLYQTDEAGNKYGTGLPQSIFDADPKDFGNMIKMYTQPTCSYDPAVSKINSAMENLGRGYTDHFTLDGWKNMNNAQKETALRTLSRMVADAAGVDPNSFSFSLINDPSKGLNGYWDPSNRRLALNANSNNFDNPMKMVKTLCHEMRHAAQGDPNADLGGGQEYRDLITWNDNNANYRQSGIDFTRYSGQLLERDADAFGRTVANEIMKNVIGNKLGH